MQYAIFLQIDDDQWDYLRKKLNVNTWTDRDPPLLFNSKEEAEIECAKWNTGDVVEYPYHTE